MRKLHVDFNAPVILTMTLASFVLLLVSLLFGNGIQRFFGVYYSSWADPLMYLRMITHIFAHADFAHFTGNFMLILAIGPMVEEKYGSRRLAMMILLTALVTGLVNVIFFRNMMLMGASGVVFMLILLASFVNIREGKFPLTVILVTALYIGNEIYSGVTQSDNISQTGHIIGGLCGGAFGFVFHGDKIRKKV